jgi:hypothetical protein
MLTVLGRGQQGLREQFFSRPATPAENPLLQKLTDYHRRISKQVDNIVTEKLSPEVEAVIADVSEVDDIQREFKWRVPEDVERLNRLNEEVVKSTISAHLFYVSWCN